MGAFPPRSGPSAVALWALLAAGCGGAGDAVAPSAGGHEGTRGDPPAHAGVPVPVRAAGLTTRTVHRHVEAMGHAESLREVEVVSRVTERVLTVEVEEGDDVRAGAVLARLDPTAAGLAVQELSIEHALAGSRLAAAELAVEEASNRLAQAEVEQARARSDHARNLEISRELLSPRDLEESASRLAQADLERELRALAGRRAELEAASARHTLEKAGVLLEKARLDLAEYEVRSPIHGVVAWQAVRGGEMVGPSTGPLFRVVDRGDLHCRIHRPQQELGQVRPGQEASLSADAWPGREFAGEVDLVSPVVDRATGTFWVRVRIQDPEGLLRPGMFLRTRIRTAESRDALMLPRRALLYEEDRPVAFVVRDGRAARLAVQTGIEDRDAVEATNRGEQGFRAGDLVVVSGHRELRDGTRVEVVGQ